MAARDSANGTRLIYQLQRCFVAVEARKAELLAEVDLLPSHYALMMNVRSHPGVTGAELARLLGVTPQNVTGLVARLTARGLVERRAHERHANVLELRLTEQGAALLARADALVGGLEDSVVAVLSSGEVDSLKRHLELLRLTVTDDA